MKNRIYLDNSATTQTDEKVIRRLSDFLRENYANPSSQHSLGKSAREEIESAREEIAKSINANQDEIIFTSGGTESDNLAIKGIAFFQEDKSKNQIITSKIEHPAILRTCEELENAGFKIDYISVDKEGIINLEELKSKISEKTAIVSVMHANNEIGTIQPIEKIGKICREKNIPFHTDAVQSFSKIKINVKKQNIDLLSVSGHKINAPKGSGFLYVRKDLQKNLNKLYLQTGGGQEFNLRGGTENTEGIIALAEALKIKRDNNHTKKVRDYLIKKLQKIPGTKINGSIEKRLCHNVNVSFYGIEGESLMLILDKKNIFVSTGSACSSAKLQESHVLKAIHTEPLYTHGSIRITLDNRKNYQLTKSRADFVIKNIKQSVDKLRKISLFKLK